MEIPPTTTTTSATVVQHPNYGFLIEDGDIQLKIILQEETVTEENYWKSLEEEVDETHIIEDQPTLQRNERIYRLLHVLGYPAQARRMGIEGKVFVQFVVGKDGTRLMSKLKRYWCRV